MSLLEKIVKAELEAKKAVADAEVAKLGRETARQRRIDRVRRLVIWHGWRLIDVPGKRFAFVRADDETIRDPIHGSYTLTEAERFLTARIEERWEW